MAFLHVLNFNVTKFCTFFPGFLEHCEGFKGLQHTPPSYTLTAREKVNITLPQIPTMICQTNLFLATTFEDKLVYVYINFWYENHTYTHSTFLLENTFEYIHYKYYTHIVLNLAVFAANTGPKLLLCWNFVLLEKKKKYYLFLKSIIDLDMKSLFF